MPTQVTVGQPFSARITGAPGAVVSVAVDGVPAGAIRLDGTGSGTVALTAWSSGTHRVDAVETVFSFGIPTFRFDSASFTAVGPGTPGTTVVPSTTPGTTVPPTTSPGTTAPPTTRPGNPTVVVAPSSPVVGTPVAITATFPGATSGRVDFLVGSIPIGSVSVNSNGQAVLRQSIWSVGPQTVTATYDDSFGHLRTVSVSVTVIPR